MNSKQTTRLDKKIIRLQAHTCSFLEIKINGTYKE